MTVISGRFEKRFEILDCLQFVSIGNDARTLLWYVHVVRQLIVQLISFIVSSVSVYLYQYIALVWPEYMDKVRNNSHWSGNFCCGLPLGVFPYNLPLCFSYPDFLKR